MLPEPVAAIPFRAIELQGIRPISNSSDDPIGNPSLVLSASQEGETTVSDTLPLADPVLKNQTLRGTIQTWIRWTFGPCLFLIPFCFRSLGVTFGLAVFALTTLLNYVSFIFLYNASEIAASNFYPEVVERILGPRYARVFRVSYFCDMTSCYILSILSGWQFFESILRGLGLARAEWIPSEDVDEFNQYHPQVFLLRLLFFSVVFGTSIPLLLKKTIKEFSGVMGYHLFSLIALAVLLLLQMPFYFLRYRSEGTLDVNLGVAPPSLNWSEAFFNILYIIYLQPYVLSLKDEMQRPTKERLMTLTRVGSAVQVAVCLVFGLLGYLSLGNRFTPYYFLDKKSLDNWALNQLETAATVVLFVTTVYSNPVYNPIYRPLLAEILGIRGKEQGHYRVLSLLPFLVFSIFGVLIPGLYRVIYWLGTPVYMFNAFITPGFLQWKLNSRLGKGRVWIISVFWYLVFFILAAVVGEAICLYRFSP